MPVCQKFYVTLPRVNTCSLSNAYVPAERDYFLAVGIKDPVNYVMATVKG